MSWLLLKALEAAAYGSPRSIKKGDIVSPSRYEYRSLPHARPRKTATARDVALQPSSSSGLMPMRHVYIRKQRNEIGLPCGSGLGQDRLHLSPDRLSGQAERGREVFDGFPLKESVGGTNFGGR